MLKMESGIELHVQNYLILWNRNQLVIEFINLGAVIISHYSKMIYYYDKDIVENRGSV